MDAQAVSFRVGKDELASAVGWVARNLPTKPTQPMLRAMLISATDEGLELAGYDYEVSTKVRASADIEQTGTVAVAGRLLAEIISSLPGKPIEMKVAGNSLEVTCGTSRFELPLIPLDDYPPMPKLPEVTGEFSPALFERAISQVSSAAGSDDTLPMLTGIHMEIDGENVTLTATDRFRLAQRRLRWLPQVEQAKAKLLIPAKNLSDHAHTLSVSGDEQVEIAVGTGEQIGAEGLFGLHYGNRQTTMRMLDADFPNVAPLLPKTHTSVAKVNINQLVSAIKRVTLVDRGAQLRLQFSEGQLILSAGASDAGHAEEMVECEYSGEDNFIIAFNARYLQTGLNSLGTENVVFGFNEPSRPAILVPEPEQMPSRDEQGVFPTPETDYTYLLMPVRLPG
ncbi:MULTISPECIES: DNA polymerase III subunit beta [Corynebacterium]|uniref:Beta sliding clamp n=2 Tax=Corynebacterium TaxID=1716 RepID=A0A3G6IRG5_9CORY|nr:MULTISPECIES: DNA polymerase III subunit beta [Corynebacterium]AZA08156.1 DNA polymerase III subunit beta [Corynebacterium pseudopelargi]QAU51309.1 DNA polymerase III subunit beta [Corynebacterium pelargi]GGG81830.1 DNA polymerase III subunit beta [Corynebacterium pelargi]